MLLDLRMPRMNGIECLARIRESYPQVKVVVFSAVEEQAQIQAALAGGASAYVVKTAVVDDLAAVIRQVVEGGNVFYRPLPVAADEELTAAGGLTKREREILALLARGLSNDEIGKRLFLGTHTVKFHLTNVYRKLGVRNRTQAARHALGHGLTEGGDLLPSIEAPTNPASPAP